MPQRFKGSKKERMFELFRQGFEPKSPEVKALKMKESTRYKYYHEWLDRGSPRSTIPPEAKVKAGTALANGESIGAFIEPEMEMEKPKVEDKKPKLEGEEPREQKETIGIVSEVPKGEAKEKEEEKKPKEEKKLPTTVVEDGIRCQIFLSLKTLALYRIAATYQSNHGGNLSLGDFLDTCAEDFFKVRGKDLGLINIEGE